VAATGSDAGSGGVLAGHVRRSSLRLRLTLLYGACFLVAAGAVLAVTYGLVAHDTGSQTRHLDARGAKIQLPKSPVTLLTVRPGASAASSGKPTVLTIEQPRSYPDSAFGPRLTAAQLARVQSGALAMAACMRGHGVDIPNPIVTAGPGGHGLEYGFTRAERDSHRFAFRSPAYNAVNHTCGPLMSRTFPSDLPTPHQIASSAQKRVDLIVNQANVALTTQRRSSLRALLTWSGVALGVMAVISILLGWLLAGRALRPMRTITSRARRITEENLHERLSADTGEDELGELANTFDGVLARLERAFDSQKRFVANASHELRTPVTLERALLEIALADPDADAETLRRTCERVLASTGQQQQTIEALLTLARSQGGTDVDAPVDLADLAQDAITLREPRLDDITVAGDLHPARLTGDPALVERLVANLIDNAIIHNRADDAWITIETGDDEAVSWLRVSNSGADVPEWMISEIFEPFRRLDGERTATAAGLGLGLSIVQAIADVHGATVEARPVTGGGLRVEVRF
jgi:signal transduction histidine kinase